MCVASTGQLFELVPGDSSAAREIAAAPTPKQRGKGKGMTAPSPPGGGLSPVSWTCPGSSGFDDDLRRASPSSASPYSAMNHYDEDEGFTTVQDKGGRGKGGGGEESGRYAMRPIEGVRRVICAAVGIRHTLAISGVVNPSKLSGPGSGAGSQGQGGGVRSLVSLCEEAVKSHVDFSNVCQVTIHILAARNTPLTVQI